MRMNSVFVSSINIKSKYRKKNFVAFILMPEGKCAKNWHRKCSSVVGPRSSTKKKSQPHGNEPVTLRDAETFNDSKWYYFFFLGKCKWKHWIEIEYSWNAESCHRLIRYLSRIRRELKWWITLKIPNLCYRNKISKR